MIFQTLDEKRKSKKKITDIFRRDERSITFWYMKIMDDDDHKDDDERVKKRFYNVNVEKL